MIRNAWPYLQQIQNDHDTGRENYLHNNYDPFVFYPAFTETNVLTMVRSCLVEGLNRRLKLPSAIIILLSDQLIIEDPLYLPSEVERKIKWILREIEASIKIRKSSLPLKAYTFGEPRIMFVRAFHNTMANYVSREILLKFNNTLCRLCMAKAVYTIPTDNYQDAAVRCFDYDGKTQIKRGFELLWLDIIRGIKKHDESDKWAEIANIIKENTEHPRDTKNNKEVRHRSKSNQRNNSYRRDDTGGGRSRHRDDRSHKRDRDASPRSKYYEFLQPRRSKHR